MIAYQAPVADISFVLNRLIGLDTVTSLPGYDAATPDLVEAVLEEAGKLAANVLAPLNDSGDREGAVWENGAVRTPRGFREAYQRFIEGGWNGLPFDPDFGGQGLPWTVAIAVQEMWQSANMAFALCPMLNQGAVEALTEHGSAEQQRIYLPRLISGEWSGTMGLSEPQAGSDLGAVRTRAERDGDAYRITGQKIFITYGDHDLTENIVHLVLARLPDAPAGSRGISLFIVPKYLVNDDGTLGPRNDVRCVSIEHKLGIHGSPTAVLAFGDDTGARGFLVGEENRGLEYMFTMMNNARLNVGLQGVAIGERAYQQARDYARTRIQSRDLARPKGDPVAIIRHPDVRRMLLTMRAQTEAGRALTYIALNALDVAKRHPDAAARAAAQARVDLLTPVIKAWCSDMGVEVASVGIQVHGGMGFVEETGAAQYYRDARIAPIYEGTNGIQAADLVFRKVGRDGGMAARGLIGEIRATVDDLRHQAGADLAMIAGALDDGATALDSATAWIVDHARTRPLAAASASAPYLRLFAIVTGGWLMARAALVAQKALAVRDGDPAFMETKVITARFFAEQILPHARALLTTVTSGDHAVMALSDDRF